MFLPFCFPVVPVIDQSGVTRMRARTRRAPTLVPLRVHNPNLRRQGAKCLLVLVEEVVVGSVRHELSLTHSAGSIGGRSSVGV